VYACNRIGSRNRDAFPIIGVCLEEEFYADVEAVPAYFEIFIVAFQVFIEAEVVAKAKTDGITECDCSAETPLRIKVLDA
jgi:hypothetical protein